MSSSSGSGKHACKLSLISMLGPEYFVTKYLSLCLIVVSSQVCSSVSSFSNCLSLSVTDGISKKDGCNFFISVVLLDYSS